MKVIEKSGLVLFAGCLVSICCLTQGIGQSKISSDISASVTQPVSSPIEKEEEVVVSETAINNDQVQTALAQLRKNVDLSTSNLLVSTTEN